MESTGGRFALCSGLGQPLHPDMAGFLERFVCFPEPPIDLFFSTLESAPAFFAAPVDLLLAEEGGETHGDALVQIRGGQVLVGSVPRTGLIHFPPSAVGGAGRFAVVNVTAGGVGTYKEALEDALAGMRDAEHGFALALAGGRVCALARQWWDADAIRREHTPVGGWAEPPEELWRVDEPFTPEEVMAELEDLFADDDDEAPPPPPPSTPPLSPAPAPPGGPSRAMTLMLSLPPQPRNCWRQRKSRQRQQAAARE